VITVNTASGNNSAVCCINGECVCSSLSNALFNIASNTAINITSKTVVLRTIANMGPGNLTNITVSGNGATVMCNNRGGVHCESCANVIIEGITWDKCGDQNVGFGAAGITFDTMSNLSLISCTFQYSNHTWAVALYAVSDNILIHNCNFLSNNGSSPGLDIVEYGGISIYGANSNTSIINVTVIGSNFFHNGHSRFSEFGGGIAIDDTGGIIAGWSITILQSNFAFNDGAGYFVITCANSLPCVQFKQITVCNNTAVNSTYAGILVWLSASRLHSSTLFSSSVFDNNMGTVLWYSGDENLLIHNSTFRNNVPSNNSVFPTMVAGAAVELYPRGKVALIDVLLEGNIAQPISSNDNDLPSCGITTSSCGGTIFIQCSSHTVINLRNTHVKGNQYLGNAGGVIYTQISSSGNLILVDQCTFSNVSSSGRGAVMYVDAINSKHSADVKIINSTFGNTVAGDSSIYIQGSVDNTEISYKTKISLQSSQFSNNIGSSLRLSACSLYFSGNVMFINNTADNGGALYLSQDVDVGSADGTIVQFVNNKVLERGGAIYVELEQDFVYNKWQRDMKFLFINNSAVTIGNSIYFYVPTGYPVNRNINDKYSILFIPCQFNYSQISDGKMRNFNCSMLNVIGFPIVTVPHELRLYCSDVSYTHNQYDLCFIGSKILGHQVIFRGGIFDYYGIPTEAILFTVECVDCLTTIKLQEDHILVGQFTPVSITFIGPNLMKTTNITVKLTSSLISLQQFSASLVVELLPCSDQPGNVYSEEKKACTCYHHNIHCFNNSNSIKRGYWFGIVLVRGISTPTTSICPNHYWDFIHHSKSAEEEYVKLPKTIDAQCKHHRSGIACGECSPKHTVTFDSTDCISKDHCGVGMTVLVVGLTFLYWAVVVGGVFLLMYFKIRMKSGLGYLYGIIYYYSVVGILLDNNPYILGSAFYFVSSLSSFAQLTPQFLGKLCLAKGLSGIDQLFIQYLHAIAIVLLICLIVVAARWSGKVTVFIKHSILSIMCLLLLLSYTSFASTSLRLLRPLRFTDIDEMHTCASPHIKYFHSRHAIYGTVAALIEVIMVIGFPLFLLLEKYISRRIVVKVMPLLMEFQDCFKDKHRWFSAYYLICRQVIVVIVYFINSDYYNMLFTYRQLALLLP